MLEVNPTFYNKCECISPSECVKTQVPDNLEIGQVVVKDDSGCCPKLYIKCVEESKCPLCESE